MIVRFSASNIVAMIFFIPLLLALGLIMAFLVPLFALIIAGVSLLFLGLYAFAKIGLVKPKSSGARLGPVDTSRLGKQQIHIGIHTGSSSKEEKGKIKEVKDYKIR